MDDTKTPRAEKHTRPLLALRALRLLVRRPHTPTELGAALGVSRPATVRLLRAMRADGLEITRAPMAADGHDLLSVSREAALRAMGLELEAPSALYNEVGLKVDKASAAQAEAAMKQWEDAPRWRRIFQFPDGVRLEVRPDESLVLPPESEWPAFFERLEEREEGLVGVKLGIGVVLKPRTT